MQSIYVPTGQRVNITLSDGTNVWLNARTKIVYPAVFDKSVRQVAVDGEAYFDVAKDKKRPFIVETGKCNMEVLGTKFNVEGYSDKDDFEVTLMEGSVRVASRIGLGDTLMLKPDSKACLQKDGRLKVIPVDDYNPYRWKEGLICFRNESFLSIMSDLEKYFGVSIVVENKNVLKYYFTGKFRQADGIDYALRVLQRDIRFKYERDDENQIIYIRVNTSNRRTEIKNTIISINLINKRKHENRQSITEKCRQALGGIYRHSNQHNFFNSLY